MSRNETTITGTYKPEWARIHGMPGPFTYRVVEETLDGDRARTLSIVGKVRNVESIRDGSSAIPRRSVFQHGGHLIAARFGGPTRPENLARMHGATNMSGGAWYRMEQEIAKLLGDDEGTMLVVVEYEGPVDEVPSSYRVQVATPRGKRLTQKVQNENPLLLPPTHPEMWRMRILFRLKDRRFRIRKELRDRVLACDNLERLKELCARVDLIQRPSELFEDA